MRRIALVLLLPALVLVGCSEEPSAPPVPGPSAGWSLIGDRTTDAATSLLYYQGRLLVAVDSRDEEEWQDSRVGIYERVSGAWTRRYSEVSGERGALFVLGEDLYLGGFVWESEGKALNGLARWDDSLWTAVGPERPENANLWSSTWDLVTQGGECLIAVCRGVFGEYEVGEWVNGEIVYSSTTWLSPQFAERWGGELVIGGYPGGESPCEPGPRILLQSGAEWLRFDGDVDAAGNCPTITGGTLWRGQLVLAGTALPDRGSMVGTWDGADWGTLGSRADIHHLQAFGDRLLGWSRSGAVYEMGSEDWVVVGGPPPGTVEDLVLVDGQVVICGAHQLGGGYVAVAGVDP